MSFPRSSAPIYLTGILIYSFVFGICSLVLGLVSIFGDLMAAVVLPETVLSFRPTYLLCSLFAGIIMKSRQPDPNARYPLCTFDQALRNSQAISGFVGLGLGACWQVAIKELNTSWLVIPLSLLLYGLATYLPRTDKTSPALEQ